MKSITQTLIYQDGRHVLRIGGLMDLPLPHVPGVAPAGVKLLALRDDGWMHLAKTIARLHRDVRRGGTQRQRRARRARARALTTLSAWVKLTPSTTAVINPQLEQGK